MTQMRPGVDQRAKDVSHEPTDPSFDEEFLKALAVRLRPNDGKSENKDEVRVFRMQLGAVSVNNVAPGSEATVTIKFTDLRLEGDIEEPRILTFGPYQETNWRTVSSHWYDANGTTPFSMSLFKGPLRHLQLITC